ncbi:hypothetical protein [Miniphocaeibacter massiliensis]|uniref:hypothetical protein n=1 Tax=Miniphocaeibacter massiliensis TaxID=2041841 RepID=UPI000C1B9985|nr:hypothetical protein [Miniphocaeibacter massiliensis]
MGVKEIGENKYKVSFTQGYREEIQVGQNETGRVLNFLITDENNKVVNTEGYTFKMLIITKWDKYELEGIRQEDKSFDVLLTSESLQHWDTGAYYQLFLSDDTGTVLTKVGTLEIYKDRRIRDVDDINLQIDYEYMKRILVLLDGANEKAEMLLEKAIEIKNEVLPLQEDVKKIKDEYIEINNKLVPIYDVAKYLEENIEKIDANVETSTKSATEAEASAKRAEEVKASMNDIFETEEARKQAHEERTTTFNNWWNIIENTATGWKATWNKWTTEFKNWISKFEVFQTNEDTRIANENTRISSEENRRSSFERWALQFQDFITNDSNHNYNEEQRTIKMNEIISAWEDIKNDLSDGDLGQIALDLNNLKDITSNHIKTLTINSIDNTLEAWFEKDVSTPSIILNLPKGFSGSYNDLINKPDLTQMYTNASISGETITLTKNNGSKTPITLPKVNYNNLTDKPVNISHTSTNYSLERFGNQVNMIIKAGTPTATVRSWVLPINFRPRISQWTSSAYRFDSLTVHLIYAEITESGKVNLNAYIKATQSEVINKIDGTVSQNIVLNYSI